MKHRQTKSYDDELDQKFSFLKRQLSFEELRIVSGAEGGGSSGPAGHMEGGGE